MHTFYLHILPMIYLSNSPLFKLMFIIVALYLGFYINFESGIIIKLQLRIHIACWLAFGHINQCSLHFFVYKPSSYLFSVELLLDTIWVPK
jgi:hypothetical protein